MSGDLLATLQRLIAESNFRVSDHGYEELQNDGLLAKEVLEGAKNAVVVEDYPTFAKGPCVLVLQTDSQGRGIHVLWGLRAGTIEPAVLITCYRPDPAKWSPDFL